MPYDEDLADRVRRELRERGDIAEKRMFGGIGFLMAGNMCVGIWRENLIARIGPDSYQDALSEPGVQEFDITGRPMRGWVMVEADAIDNAAALRAWLRRCLAFVATLPAK